ncbi:unnamed protein product, partial [Tenebrio molitor]
MLNATFEVVEPPNRAGLLGVIEDISSGRSDFSFNTCFLFIFESYDIEYSYPHQMDALVVLIPTDDNFIKDTSILSIFHPSVWFLFVVVIVANALTSKSVNKIDSFNKLILYYFGSLLGIPWPRLTSKYFSIKLKLLIFLLCSIIFRTAFQCFLTGSFLGSHFFQEITTISELSKSDIMIRGSQPLVDLIPEEFGLSGKFIFMRRYERNRLLQKLDRTAAFLIDRDAAKELLTMWKTGGHILPFYVMEEALLPGIDTYFFHKNSPYMEKIEECLQRDREFALWRGGDYVRLRMVASMMNASFTIIEPPEQTYYTGAYQDAMSDVTDFCFISHFYMSYLYQDADYTYPHEQNEIAVVIPRGESSEFDTYTMLSIFDPVTWGLLFTSIVVVSLVTFLSNKRQSLSAIFLQSFNSFLGNPIHDFNSKPTSVKIQLLAFILGCIICGTAFQSFLVSSFVNPKSYQHITTISELRNSKLNIYTSIFLAKMIPPEHGLCGRVFVITAAERVKRLYSLDTRTAYVIIGTFARKFVETLESKYDLPPFYIMKEPLVPSANTYIFQRHSPYLDKISNCLQRLIQHGLLNSREYRRLVGRNSTQSDDKIVLEWTGRDYTLLKTVTSMVNATFTIVEPPPGTNYNGAYEDMQSDKADFCFISHFYKEKIDKELECSYPHEKNGISLLMPVMHRKKTLFLVFQPFTWLLLVTGKIIISLTILLTDKNQQKSLSESVLYVFSCFLGYAFPRFHSKRFIIKFQIIIFVVGSIILRTAFQCFLISYFIKSSPAQQINTITQLQNSDVKIYMS